LLPNKSQHRFCVLNNYFILVVLRLLTGLKKIASILLLGMLLFNWCGYRWVINYLQKDADIQLEARLDKNDYDESQLIEIKVPINMPYQSDWAAFERYDGEIEVNGVHYKYVKRKVQDGQLVLKCIPNQTKQRLENVKDDLFKIVNDLQQDHAAKKPTAPNSILVKNVLGDFDSPRQLNMLALSAPVTTQTYNLYNQLMLANHLRSTPEQPPEA
jgi:hypothetical protein